MFEYIDFQVYSSTVDENLSTDLQFMTQDTKYPISNTQPPLSHRDDDKHSLFNNISSMFKVDKFNLGSSSTGADTITKSWAPINSSFTEHSRINVRFLNNKCFQIYNPN
jgi:hypothetical protein